MKIFYTFDYFVMSEKIINIQDAFLNYMRKNKTPVTVFLLNGVKLTGVIACFDKSTVILRRDGYIQMIYKHAISTFYPHGSVSVFDWNVSQSFSSKKTEDDDTLEVDELEIEGEYEEEDDSEVDSY
jgi:host factor-I protein